ncbi:DinB family protein [Pontibacter sp. G13]|uniref:DinB family protein n=1 Tax=Pontibacter sp. G13 TaxID=3074898 RepID=UPI002889F6F0|nr:DinB family protein [Pontibacter sp. G13]WNJ17992.1 DinB family protein [Pontibacter sp. G13]
MVIIMYVWMMEYTWNVWSFLRTQWTQLLKDHTQETLSIIPTGFNNSPIWNAGHVCVTQQLLCYNLSGLSMNVSDELIAQFRKGTFAKAEYAEGTKEEIMQGLAAMVALTQTDFAAGKFKDFQAYTTSSGYLLENFEQALSFNLQHEAYHLGVARSQQRLI